MHSSPRPAYGCSCVGRARLDDAGVRAERSRDSHGYRVGCLRWARAGRDRHGHQPGHQHGLYRRHERSRQLHHHQPCRSATTPSPSISRASRALQSKMSLSAGQTARVDFKMEVGGVEETASRCVATGAILQTENAVVGIKVDREQIERLPAQGRNLSSLTLYTAGVTSTNPSQFDSMRGGGRPPSTASASRATTSPSTAWTRTRPSTTASPTSRARTRWSRSASRPTTTRPSSGTSPAPWSTW